MKIKAAFALLSILGIVGLAIWLWSVIPGLKRAPEVTFSTLNGEEITMRELQRRPALVTFWSTACLTCLKEIPHLIKLYKEFRNRGFNLIGVAMPYDPPNQVLELATERQLPYPIALDPDGALASAFGNVKQTPTSFLIAPNGRIIKRTIGALNMALLRQQIEVLLPTPG